MLWLDSSRNGRWWHQVIISASVLAVLENALCACIYQGTAHVRLLWVIISSAPSSINALRVVEVVVAL